MKKITLLLCFTLTLYITYAQKIADKDFYLVDSIVLENIDDYSLNFIDSTLQLYHKTSNDTIQLAYLEILLNNIGDLDLLWKYNDFMLFKAIESLKKAKNNSVKKKINFYLATSYGNKGVLFDFENKDDSTFFYYTKALKLFTVINDLSGMANVNGFFGVYYDVKGNVNKALYYYNEGLKVAELSGNNQSIAMALIKVASIQKDYREFDKALENGIKAVDYCVLANDNQTLVSTYQLISTVYYRSNDFKNAKINAIKSIDICKKINNDYWLANGYNLLAKAYHSLNQLDSSELYFKLAMNEAERINAADDKMIALQGLARVAIEKEDYKNAELYGIEAQEIAQKLKSRDYTSKTSEILSKVFEMKGDYKKALEYNHIYSSLKDSIHNSKTQKDAIRMGIQYDYDKEVALVEQEKVFAQELATKNKKLFLVSATGGLLLFLLALIYIYQIKLKKRTEIAELKLIDTQNTLNLERKYRNAELKALKAQMNPHFLFNAFNSIQEFIIMNKKEVASEFLGKFADLMRLYLEQSRALVISLEDELKSLSLYLELEKVRFDDTLDYSINLSKEVHQETLEIPPLIIQPFVENALKHGLLHRKTNRKLWVNFSLENDVMICKIKDNGIGRKKSAELNANKVKMHNSFAISSIENRINLLNVNREKDITLKIVDLIDESSIALGTEVILSIPL